MRGAREVPSLQGEGRAREVPSLRVGEAQGGAREVPSLRGEEGRAREVPSLPGGKEEEEELEEEACCSPDILLFCDLLFACACLVCVHNRIIAPP